MVRNYVKKVGGRRYCQFKETNMQDAIAAVQSGMSRNAASIKYKVSRTTLSERISGKHTNKVGHPTVFTKEEESLISETIGTVSEWGYPMTSGDIASVISGFVNKQGRKVQIWKDNRPGYDFVKSFAIRNNLRVRLATNIKQNRASVGQCAIREFFTNIEPHLVNAPRRNIYNYDKTNITDDPGSKRVLVPRGMKRVERIKEHSRSSISIMICGTADGELLPPMVVYKSKNLYNHWTQGGPPGTVYNHSKSGWFDMNLFEQWFVDILLPHIKEHSQKNEQTIVIGDNLASHFSPLVIQTAKENNIYMTPLPPNSTHLLQPLDVSFFAPMKRKWRAVLDNWRKESRRKGTIPKEQFPALLNKLCGSMSTTAKANLEQPEFVHLALTPFYRNFLTFTIHLHQQGCSMRVY